MQMKPTLPWLLCAALGMLASWLLFKLVDQSVTLDHQTQYATVVLKQRNVLAHVLNATGTKEPESKVRDLLNHLGGEATFDKGTDEVVAEQVSFFFRDGQLLRVDVGDDTAR